MSKLKGYVSSHIHKQPVEVEITKNIEVFVLLYSSNFSVAIMFGYQEAINYFAIMYENA